MNIGEAAQKSGLPAKTIRYHDDIGLVRPSRGENGYRDNSKEDVHELKSLGRARSFGFAVGECRQLLSLYGDRERASSDVTAVALRLVEEKIAELEGLRSTSDHLVEACRGDDRPECPILDDLSDATKGRYH